MRNLLYILLFVPLALFGQENYSLSFDGVNDYVEISNSLDFDLGDFTIIFKFKTPSTTSNSLQGLVSKSCSGCEATLGDWFISYNHTDSGRVMLFTEKGGLSGFARTGTLSLDTWYSIGVRRIESTGELFITSNIIGAPDTTVSESGAPTGIINNTESFVFGNMMSTASPYEFEGFIDDVSLWNFNMSYQIMKDYMSCSPSGSEQGLVGYWNFNEGSGDVLFDLSGNSNNGEINGATYSADVPGNNCEVYQSNDLASTETLTEGLVAYYPFNGNANDESGNGNHGEVINATLIEDRIGIPNNAYEFDANYQFTNGGAESYIQLPEISTNIGAPNSSFSISMWFSCYDPSTLGNIILNGGDGYSNSAIVGRIEVSGNAIKIYHRNPTTNNEPNGSINIDSNWNNVIVIVDGELGEYKLFVNGNIDNSMTFSFDPNETYFDAERTWQIGGISYAGQNNHQFHGAIDDISFWDRILTEDEIQALSSNNILYGCTSLGTLNYNPFANSDDNSCITYHDLINSIDSLQTELEILNDEATTSLSSLQQALDTWNTNIDLDEGWNMFGYGCPSPIDVSEGLSNHTEIAIVKDNNGSVYMPEFSFNGIGDFTPGFGYQIKLTEAIEGFSLCDWYVNDIPEDNILSLQDSIINMHNTNCVEDGYCGYDVIFSNCFNPNEGFDCEGNEEIEYSLSFDEVDDMVSCGSTIDISSSFSIAAWVYALPNMANYTIASKREMHQNGGDYYNGFHLTLENDELGSGDDGLRFVLHNNSQGDINKAIAPLNFNQWNYVVGVFDSGSSIKLYINGELVDNAPTSLTSIGALSSTADFLIGAAGNYPTFPVGNYINGNLEDVSLWDIPLTQQEINDCMNCPLTGVEEGLVGYWNFNEGEGNTVYDISGNGNHGAINGGAIFSIDVPENICE